MIFINLPIIFFNLRLGVKERKCITCPHSISTSLLKIKYNRFMSQRKNNKSLPKKSTEHMPTACDLTNKQNSLTATSSNTHIQMANGLCPFRLKYPLKLKPSLYVHFHCHLSHGLWNTGFCFYTSYYIFFGKINQKQEKEFLSNFKENENCLL